MKKSLIALAVLATAAGAVSAQTVTLSGRLRFAYEQQTVDTKTAVPAAAAVAAVPGPNGAAAKAAVTAVPVGSADTNGLRVTDGHFTLVAVEDLGGGMKMKAAMEVLSRGRDTAIIGRDASLTLSGGFGAVLIGAIEAGNGILGLGGAGSPGMYGLDGAGPNGKIALAAAGNVDILRYYTPNMSGFTGYVSLIDGTTAGGMEDLALRQDATQIGMTYGAGPIAAAADFTNYGLNGLAAGADNRLRVSGSYNLGVAKLGLGYEKRKMTTANTDSSDVLLGVAVPFGNTTVGLNYARRTGDAASFNQAATGYDFGVKYDLSKRTYVAFAYQSVTGNAAAGVAQDTLKRYRVQLATTF